MKKNILIISIFAAFISSTGQADDLGLVVGKEKYQETCIACHGEKGKGELPGIPDFTKKNSVLAQSTEKLFSSIVNGLERPGADIAMPPMGANPDLSEKEVMDIIAYMKNAFLRE